MAMDKLINSMPIACMGLLLFIVYCNCITILDKIQASAISNKIQVYADHGDIIDGLFKPERMLGEGGFADVWKGIN